jgi:hypothetical protein
MRTDPTYRAPFGKLRMRVICDWRDEAVKRAKGTRKLVLYEAKPVYIDGIPYYEVQVDVPMLWFLLQGWDRKHTVTGRSR